MNKKRPRRFQKVFKVSKKAAKPKAPEIAKPPKAPGIGKPPIAPEIARPPKAPKTVKPTKKKLKATLAKNAVRNSSAVHMSHAMPHRSMAKSLGRFMTGLALDPEKFASFIRDPKTTIENSGL